MTKIAAVPDDGDAELAALRAEVAALRAELRLLRNLQEMASVHIYNHYPPYVPGPQPQKIPDWQIRCGDANVFFPGTGGITRMFPAVA